MDLYERIAKMEHLPSSVKRDLFAQTEVEVSDWVKKPLTVLPELKSTIMKRR
jgi:hypothetical protein